MITDLELYRALQRLNWNYGKGFVGAVVRGDESGGYFEQVVPLTQSGAFSMRRRVFRISGRTVYALKHQITI